MRVRIVTDTVNIRVEDVEITPVNNAPVAINRSLTTRVNTPLEIILNGNDKDHDALAFHVTTPPKSGKLTALSIQTDFTANINGTQEVPQNSDTNAKGSATFQYNSTSKLLSFFINYVGLMSTKTAAHIHMGAPGVDGPIQFILPIGNTKSGPFGPLSQQQEISLLQGNMYVNIHSPASS